MRIELKTLNRSSSSMKRGKMEKLKEFGWLFKSSIFVVAYAVIALVVYDIVAEIHIQPPRTLFTPIDHVISFILFFVVPYVFIFIRS